MTKQGLLPAIAVSFGIGLAIFALFEIMKWPGLFGAALLAILVPAVWYTIVWGSHRWQAWRAAQSPVKYVRNLEAAPEYKWGNLLKLLNNNDINRIEVVARTAFRLLAGDERLYKEDKSKFNTEHVKLQGDLAKALASGGEVVFVIKNPNLPIYGFENEQNELLRKQGLLVIKSYKAVKSKVELRWAQGISLSITDTVVDDSMVRITYRNGNKILIRDLSIKFRKQDQGSGVDKPFLVFQVQGNGEESKEFMDEFNTIQKESLNVQNFEEKLTQGIDIINRQIKTHTQFHSKLRQDQSMHLAYSAANSFISERTWEKPKPPICVQFLITNRCTNTCSMCDHHKLYDKGNELSPIEVENVLKSISKMGTKAVVISGGEPLAHESLGTILSFARNQCDLHIGLITNGVCSEGNQNHKAVDRNIAGIIAQTCNWIQISIDSFDPIVYQSIRGGDFLQFAKDSIKNIYEEKGNGNGCLKNIQICYTIQKNNISVLDNDLEKMDKELPQDVSVRLKIAHGPENGRKFLITRSELSSVILTLQKWQKNRRFNTNYILSMINKGYFEQAGLCEGKPLSNIMTSEFKRKKFLCLAMRLTCILDANGDVYPCCFLFDDNHADSEIRNRYKIGSLKEEFLQVPDPYDDGNENTLANIWYNNPLLNGFRQEQLPVDMQACLCCTRYFYQNELLNEVYNVFSEYKKFGVAEEFIEQHAKTPKIDDPFWI